MAVILLGAVPTWIGLNLLLFLILVVRVPVKIAWRTSLGSCPVCIRCMRVVMA